MADRAWHERTETGKASANRLDTQVMGQTIGAVNQWLGGAQEGANPVEYLLHALDPSVPPGFGQIRMKLGAGARALDRIA